MPHRKKLIRTMLIFGSAATVALAACNGWPKAIEKSEAENHAEKYPTYAAAPEQTPFEFGGRHWMLSASTESLTGARRQSVGTAGNVTIYAPEGEQAPYSVLYAPAGGNKWHRVVPID